MLHTAWMTLGMPVSARLEELLLITMFHSASLASGVTCSVTRAACSHLGWPVERFSDVGLGTFKCRHIWLQLLSLTFWEFSMVYPAVILAFGLGNMVS